MPHSLLAFDTSTELLSVALTDGVHIWQHSGPGGAQASQQLIPLILQLLAQAEMTLQQLDAVVFGRGPGSFTGLRTACSVAQGLAAGANLPVVPVDTLAAVAEEARFAWCPDVHDLRVSTLLDARMGEMYVQDYVFKSGIPMPQDPCSTIKPENWAVDVTAPHPVWLLAGNVFEVYALPDVAPAKRVPTLPTATALLRLAPALIAAGASVTPEHAQPLYVRDKVALTTAERAQK